MKSNLEREKKLNLKNSENLTGNLMGENKLEITYEEKESAKNIKWNVKLYIKKNDWTQIREENAKCEMKRKQRSVIG